MTVKSSKKNKNSHVTIHNGVVKKTISIPYFEEGVSAGFPSPAENFMGEEIDLNKILINNPTSTYYVRVFGDSMSGAGIISGDLLIVDRSLEITKNCIVVAHIDGEFTVKRIKKTKKKMYLVAENQTYRDIEITEEMNFELFGVVTHSIHQFT